VSIGYWDKPKG